MLFECIGICVLSPAHESEMRGYLVYVLTVKYLILFKIQSQYIRLDGLVVDFVVVVVASGGGGFLKTFLEGSVDHIIYRDYTVNRRSFIYCTLATKPQPTDQGFAQTPSHGLWNTSSYQREGAGYGGLQSGFHANSFLDTGQPGR